MIRDFRRSDGPAYFRLLTEHFPEEEKVLGMRPDAFERIVRRMYRWDVRLIVGLARIFGRPIFRLFVIEESGTLAASSLLTFSGPSGYISSVVVDVPFRRQGLAQQLLATCREATRKSGRKYVALDVLVENAPARALYEREGFHSIREQVFWVHEQPSALTLSRDSALGSFRIFRTSDARALAQIAAAQNAAPVNEILPVTPGSFTPPEFIESALLSHGVAVGADGRRTPGGLSSRLRQSGDGRRPPIESLVRPGGRSRTGGGHGGVRGTMDRPRRSSTHRARPSPSIMHRDRRRSRREGSTKHSGALHSTGRREPSPLRRRSGLDIYLLPAVVGGGLGDIEEVLCAGRRLAASGFSLRLLRARSRPLPPAVAGPWEWPPFRRVERLDDGGGGALTLSAGWGTAAAPARDEPFGRAGPWAKECGQIEDFYGADRTVHVSFEEFARTLTSRKQTAERWREGGLTTATIRRRLREQGPAEIAQFDRAYRKFPGLRTIECAPPLYHVSV